MNKKLKQQLKESVKENFGYCSEESHRLLDLIRKDEPDWVNEE